ncbi:MAG: rod shape-determining protein MreD [Flavobacteriales bacterium]
MLNNLIINIIRFIFLVLLQVLILDQIYLNGYINPFLYIMFLMMLPFDIPHWFLLIISFLLGFSVDIFSNTLGLHTSACVLIGFIRPYILSSIEPRDGYEAGMKPELQYMGLNWYFHYAGILTLIHHLWLFYLEVFRFSDFFMTLWRVILSSLFTLILIIISQYLIYKRRRT